MKPSGELAGPLATTAGEGLERAAVAAALRLPRGTPLPGWRRWGARLRQLAQQGELGRRLTLAAPFVAVGFAIWAFGGVYGWAYGLAYLSVFGALAAWSVQCGRGRWRAVWRPGYAPMAALGGLVVLQYGSGGSVVAAATATAALHLGAAAALFVVVTQLYRASDADVLATGFALFTAALALLAILQSLTASTGIYWHFTYTYASPAGSFVNRNNFAGCMEMLLPMAGAAAWRRRRRHWLRFLPWALPVGLGLTAMTLAASRGGVLALTVEAAAGAGLALYARPRRRETSAPAPRHAGRPGRALVAGALLAAALIAAAGTQRLSARLEATRFNALGLEPSLQQRHLLNLSSWSMFRARPAWGWGLGTWADVYPLYARFPAAGAYSYAHNDYLQLLAETGLAGAACVLSFWMLWGLGVRRRLRQMHRATERATPDEILMVAAGLGCLGLLAHSWVDFNLHIPANLLLFLALAALASPSPEPGT